MSVMDSVRKLLNSIVVYEVPMTKVRIGNQNDGGYVVLKEVCDRTPVVYSFGVGNDVGFELEWIKKYPKSRIELFDPYLDKSPVKHPRFNLHKSGLGGKFKPVRNVVVDSLLKIDVEGDEWELFRTFSSEEVRKFSQIVIECHFVHVDAPNHLSPYFRSMYDDYINSKVNVSLFESYYSVIRRLREWFVLFHIHANNSLPVVSLGGYWFPPLLEVSFVRRDLVRKGLKKYLGQFPIVGLDMPNKTDRPDIFDYYPMADNVRLKNGTKRTI